MVESGIKAIGINGARIYESKKGTVYAKLSVSCDDGITREHSLFFSEAAQDIAFKSLKRYGYNMKPISQLVKAASKAAMFSTFPSDGVPVVTTKETFLTKEGEEKTKDVITNIAGVLNAQSEVDNKALSKIDLAFAAFKGPDASPAPAPVEPGVVNHAQGISDEDLPY